MTSAETSSDRRRREKAPDRARGNARLAAVQALYELEMAGAPTDSVLAEFLNDRWRPAPGNGAAEEEGDLVKPDEAFFCELVRGATARHDEIGRMIGEALSGGWTLERLEPLIRTILRAGTYELLARPDVPLRVVITEYVEVAHAFFADKEPALVNGVLDRLARTLRHDELEASPGERNTKIR